MNKLATPINIVMQFREGLKLNKEQIVRIKFGLKVGVAAGACYYLAEEGVWSESTETTKLYERICNTVSPLIKEATAQVPIEIPALPDTQRISYVSKHYWNSGVMSTFEFLGKLPEHVSNWTSTGMKSISENPEMKKFMDSLSAPPQPAPTAVAPPVVEKK